MTSLQPSLSFSAHPYTQVGRYHPPAVRQGVITLDVARERLAAAAQRAWGAFLALFSQQHYAVCKVGAGCASPFLKEGCCEGSAMSPAGLPIHLAASMTTLAVHATVPVPLQAAVAALAQMDALSSLALVARSPGYCRPVLASPGGSGPPVLDETLIHMQNGA